MRVLINVGVLGVCSAVFVNVMLYYVSISMVCFKGLCLGCISMYLLGFVGYSNIKYGIWGLFYC